MERPVSNVTDVLADPSWLPHRYDAISDKVHFIRADRATRRASPFLIDEYLPEATNPVAIARIAAVAMLPPASPPHFIFHSAYCCSTLLANALDIEGVAFGLKEPTILNDISGWRRRGGQPAEVLEALKSALTLLSRPSAPDERIILKPSNVVNALAPALLAASPQSQALLLYTPMANYLASIAKKGMWGRLWARELFVKLSKDGLIDYGFTPDEILQQTDLQIAAIGWLGQHRLFRSITERFGSERVKTLQSEKLVANPGPVMHDLLVHFGLKSDEATIQSMITRGAFSQNSKTGAGFNPADRQAEHVSSSEIHREEIDKVLVWAEAVAEAYRQDLTLPSALV